MAKQKIKAKGQSPPKAPGADNTIRVVRVYTGERTASEAFHKAAVKKILLDKGKVSEMTEN
jgi:hypothetical protein